MLPGWQTDISGCVTYDELPDAAKTYVETLEDLLQHEIQFISVGAERSQYLTKESGYETFDKSFGFYSRRNV